MTAGLPKWVWDILADLIEEEDMHPKLFFTSGGFEGYRQYEWCPNRVLVKVPPEVRDAAAVIAAYRQQDDPEPVVGYRYVDADGKETLFDPADITIIRQSPS
jgi:hypothetical protein